ncbi:MAG: S46 family peptidase, partial [Gemmatimonadaceae bacterium]|nr:S46 family peptidase [Gemmatimonadaceae bacterium]
MRGWVRRGLWQAGVVVFLGRELAAQAAPRAARLPARPVEPPIEITPTTPLPDAGRMWRFEAPPTAYWMARYGFAPDAAWLRHVRRAVLRIPGCTASFVSASGLVLTNHHCAREAATQVQPADSNYQATGFIARTLAEERRIDGFTAERLDSIEDVTARIAARRAQRTAAHEADPHAAAMRALEAECVAPNEVCEVVSLYQGGRYARYRYTQFTDVRLVAIPEAQVAFFGGDQDNFTYPRFNLDFALLRVYDERGAPLVPTEHLRLNADGVREHDPVFVVGNPGATSRLHTVAQLRFERDHGVPLQLLDLEQQREVLAHRAGDAPSAQQQDALFALDNAIKAMRGQLAGLSDSALLARKARFEGTLRERVQASPRWRLAYGVAWDRLAEALARRAPLERTRAAFGGGASELWTRALGLVRLPEQAALPDARRLPPYRGDGLERVRQQVLAPVPLDTGAERLALVRLLTDATALLGASDPVVRQLLGGRTAEETVRGWLRETRLLDAQERRKLLGGG